MFVNIEGVYHIQKWIDENQDKNPAVSSLLAEGVAYEIDESNWIAQELKDNGYFSYEIGLKDGQGRQMVINLYPEHFKDSCPE